MDACNLYACLTVLATLVMAPVAYLVEGGKAKAAWDAALTVYSQKQLLNYIISSGLYFYLYNEVRLASSVWRASRGCGCVHGQ